MYIGETRRNMEIRSEKYEDTHKDSEPPKHLRNHLGYSFTWKRIHSQDKNTQ